VSDSVTTMLQGGQFTESQ